MAFDEKTKKEVKERAAFSCCRCHSKGVQVHHIVPQEFGGSDHISNAAPLCPSCHDYFGDNPKKRKEITHMRDWWYAQVEKKFPDISDIKTIKKVVEEIKDTISMMLQKKEDNDKRGSEEKSKRKLREWLPRSGLYELINTSLYELINTSYEDIIITIENPSINGDSKINTTPLITKSSNFKLSPPITAELVHRFLAEKNSIENNFKIEGLDCFKLSGLLTYWIAKLKPILILKEDPEKTEIFLNEYLAISVAVGIVYAHYNELILTQELVDELVYTLRYSHLDFRAISLIYKSFSLAMTSNQKDKKSIKNKETKTNKIKPKKYRRR